MMALATSTMVMDLLMYILLLSLIVPYR